MSNTARQRLIKADTDYGVVGDNTLRTAAQIGNAGGSADFGDGPITAQTVRTVLAEGSVVGVTPVGQGVNTFNAVSVIATGVETNVVNFTTTKEHFLLRASASGMADAVVSLKINNVIVARKRLSWTKRNVDFDFGKNGIKVNTGIEIKITITNTGEGPQPYDGNLYGEEE